MFTGCNKLNYVKCLATTFTSQGALNKWLNNVASTGTFVKYNSVTFPSGVSGIPTNWTIENIPDPDNQGE